MCRPKGPPSEHKGYISWSLTHLMVSLNFISIKFIFQIEALLIYFEVCLKWPVAEGDDRHGE